jgi:hypothetical protein
MRRQKKIWRKRDFEKVISLLKTEFTHEELILMAMQSNDFDEFKEKILLEFLLRTAWFDVIDVWGEDLIQNYLRAIWKEAFTKTYITEFPPPPPDLLNHSSF